MQGINKVILVGHVSTDVECSNTKSGMLMSTCSLATNRKKKGSDEQITQYHSLVFWERLAEIAGDYIRKGSAIYIEGSLATTRYPDKNGGPDRYSTKIHVTDMQLLDKKENNQGGGGQQQRQQHQNNNQGNNNQGGGYQRQGGQSAGGYSARNNQNSNNQSGYKTQHRNSPPQETFPDDEIPF